MPTHPITAGPSKEHFSKSLFEGAVVEFTVRGCRNRAKIRQVTLSDTSFERFSFVAVFDIFSDKTSSGWIEGGGYFDTRTRQGYVGLPE